MNKWKRKAIALAKLAEDQRGKPEGEVARQKLLQIINKYPEARDFEPIVNLVKHDLMMKDLGEIKRNGGSLAGRWDGGTLQEAIAIMEADYQERLRKIRMPKLVSKISN